MLQFHSRSVSDTVALAHRLEPLLRDGDVFLLAGDLGAGKTTFVQGLAQAMDIQDPVTSPTFTLLHTYHGRRRLHHLDLYRLEDPNEMIDLDLPALLEDHAVVAVEWGDRLLPQWTSEYLRIGLELSPLEDSPDTRTIELQPVGDAWQPRIPELTRVLKELTKDRQ